MKKEEIYVIIDSEEKRLRVIQILSDAGETILDASFLLDDFLGEIMLRFNSSNNYWWVTSFETAPHKITLDQLEELLNHKQEEPIKLDALKLIAESYGFELVEKKREPKLGDFGKFWDSEEKYCYFGFLAGIYECNTYQPKGYISGWQNFISGWQNFSHITDEEKQHIQENW